jgi:hypothetical protein
MAKRTVTFTFTDEEMAARFDAAMAASTGELPDGIRSSVRWADNDAEMDLALAMEYIVVRSLNGRLGVDCDGPASEDLERFADVGLDVEVSREPERA